MSEPDRPPHVAVPSQRPEPVIPGPPPDVAPAAPWTAVPPTGAPAAAPQPSGSRWKRLSRGTVLVLGAGIGAAVVGACWMLTSGAGGGSADSFSTNGTITLTEEGLGLDTGDACTGTDGYGDIHLGAQVSITDSQGTIVATGSLGAGAKTDEGCTFPFTVDDITPGSKFYTVEVSHRGGLTKTEDEIRAGDLAFTLGS